MLPYRGRFALRIARLILSLLCTGSYFYLWGAALTLPVIVFIAHAIYAIFVLIDVRHDTPPQAASAMVADSAYFMAWAWERPDSWQAVLAGAYLLASATLVLDWIRSVLAILVAMLVALLMAGPGKLAIATVGMGGVAAAVAFYRGFIEGRMSMTLRQNVIIRSQAQSAREAERQRIAADFHDGPLQSFVGFQMRLEIIRKMFERNPESGMAELKSLQELCKSQVADLRAFVRSMRPADEGMSLAASLSRMADSLQRDTDIAATFIGEELQDPQEVEVSLEILQIVREAFNNIQKHSGATQVQLRAHRRGRHVEIEVIDNGSGFPFAGTFTLEELDSLRIGPVSIKRRVRMLGGDLSIESRPGDGAKLTFRVPF